MKRIFYYFERDIEKWSREPDQCCGFSCDAGWGDAGGWDCAVSAAVRGFEGNLRYVVIYENKTIDKTGGLLIDPA